MSIPIEMKRYFERYSEYKTLYDYYEPLVSDEDNRFKWVVMGICKKYPEKVKYLNSDIFDKINMCIFDYKKPKKFQSYSKEI